MQNCGKKWGGGIGNPIYKEEDTSLVFIIKISCVQYCYIYPHRIRNVYSITVSMKYLDKTIVEL